MSGALSLDRVSKIYGAGGAKPVHAVRRMDMEIDAGEIVALLGSSGCGKTSTLRMIAGFEDATEGAIRLAGREIHELPPARRNVAMAFEGYSLYPPLTVRENIAFSLKSARLPRAEVEQRIGEVAALLEIEPILDRYPSSISGGQQQRASLARALARDADLHLLDEPMGQLEPQLRAVLRGRIKHFLKERGFTAILVTHDQTEANALADRIAVMEGGVLQQFAAPGELRDRPANLFVATFIGEPPMNVFEATWTVEGDRLNLTLPGGAALAIETNGFGAGARAALAGRSRAVFGLRPHSLKLAENGAPATVTANQWIGDQSHIAAEFAGREVVAVVHDRADYRPGDSIGLAFDPGDLHVFDAESGAALIHGGEAA